MSSPLPTSILFVDGTNLDHRLEHGIGSHDVDFARFFTAVAAMAGTTLLHTHYFTAPYAGSQDQRKTKMRARQQRTFNALQGMPRVSLHKEGRHQPREGRCRHCQRPLLGHDEKGTDVHAAVMLVQAAFKRAADQLIFLANDNDYVPAFQICREVGVPVALVYVASDQIAHQRVGQLRRAAARSFHIDAAFMEGLWLTFHKTK